MGGLSPDNQLKLAAVRFRQVGNDFWPGPLTNTGDASIEPEVCTFYDKSWKTARKDVAAHNAYYICLGDPNCNVSVEYPGYFAPPVFYEWPAIGDVAAGQDLYIAPFNDFNNDGDYNVDDGDSPGYDLDGSIDCKARFREDAIPLFGDENIWWVFNDKGNAHTETSGQPIGMEIRAQAFAFATNDEVNNMTFTTTWSSTKAPKPSRIPTSDSGSTRIWVARTMITWVAMCNAAWDMPTTVLITMQVLPVQVEQQDMGSSLLLSGWISLKVRSRITTGSTIH
ncbi:MAG: hypothetical protein IPO17_02500 [Flavobacteriales bacterium]|nr:hypothetical protein [Flavobacteriales bacterium]